MGGDLLYRWGNPEAHRAGAPANRQLFLQHDVRWIGAGLPGEDHILVYNNGCDRPEGDYSTVNEFIPPVDEFGDYPALTPGIACGPTSPSWTFLASPAESFYSANVSGAQRLSNGNTLICEGASGHLFEVTSGGTKVWDSPVLNGTPTSQGGPPAANSVFRCERYAPDYPGLQGRALSPGAPIEQYPFTVAATSPPGTGPFPISRDSPDRPPSGLSSPKTDRASPTRTICRARYTGRDSSPWTG